MRQFHLTWSDYLTSVSDSFISHRDCDLFTDVTLVSDDNHQVSAHRLILSAGSKYFRNILEDKKHPHPMLCLDGVNSNDLNNIVDYIYKGELLIPESSLTPFLKIATKLKCSGLNGIKSFQEVPEMVVKPEDETESYADNTSQDHMDTEEISSERIENMQEQEDVPLNPDFINDTEEPSNVNAVEKIDFIIEKHSIVENSVISEKVSEQLEKNQEHFGEKMSEIPKFGKIEGQMFKIVSSGSSEDDEEKENRAPRGEKSKNTVARDVTVAEGMKNVCEAILAYQEQHRVPMNKVPFQELISDLLKNKLYSPGRFNSLKDKARHVKRQVKKLQLEIAETGDLSFQHLVDEETKESLISCLQVMNLNDTEYAGNTFLCPRTGNVSHLLK